MARLWSIEDEARSEFSDRAHAAAQRLVYPAFFGVPTENLSFESVRKIDSDRARILDSEMAVDRVVRISVNQPRRHHDARLQLIVQERFRDAKYAHYEDVTVTEWYEQTDKPAELYHLNAGLFVYGYFDSERGAFADAVVINTASMLVSLMQGRLGYQMRRNDRYQAFVVFKFADLERCGALVWRLRKRVAVHGG